MSAIWTCVERQLMCGVQVGRLREELSKTKELYTIEVQIRIKQDRIMQEMVRPFTSSYGGHTVAAAHLAQDDEQPTTFRLHLLIIMLHCAY
jgi:hypothetical protein